MADRSIRFPALVFSCLIGQSSDCDVLKLHVPRMTLQADVALWQSGSVGRDQVARDKLTVERDLDGGASRLDFKGIPLASRFRGDLRGRGQGVDRARLV